MMLLLTQCAMAIEMAAGMLWTVAWSLVLGFVISATLQAIVPRRAMQKALGHDRPKDIVRATLFGAASSSCSYAAASIMRTLLRKGAAFIPSLAFLIASTNLVIELGLVLWLLMGWRFMAAQWLGGVVMIALMAILVRLTQPTALIRRARRSAEQGGGTEVEHVPLRAGLLERLKDPAIRIVIAHNFLNDWAMLYKDLLIGMVIAGCIAAFLPASLWTSFFQPSWASSFALPWNAIVGVLVAMLTFVCSIGNVPMAAILWAAGVSLPGVLAFLYADLVVLPLLDVYRRAFGLRPALYIGGVLIASIIGAAMLVAELFDVLDLTPAPNPELAASMTHISLNYTFWLNILAGALAVYLIVLARRHPNLSSDGHCCHGD